MALLRSLDIAGIISDFPSEIPSDQPIARDFADRILSIFLTRGGIQ